MSGKLLKDGSGGYDLSAVVAVRPRKWPATERQPAKDFAALHFNSGDIVVTQTPYAAVLAQWESLQTPLEGEKA